MQIIRSDCGVRVNAKCKHCDCVDQNVGADGSRLPIKRILISH